MDVLDPTVNWLLDSGDPSIRYLTLTKVLDRPSDSREVLAVKKQIPNGPIVKTLLSGQRADGGFGVHPYQKWTGAHWPLSRRPYLLETSLPGVFAAGDVRGGNVKRVASAVGEGSIAISFVHQLLRE